MLCLAWGGSAHSISLSAQKLAALLSFIPLSSYQAPAFNTRLYCSTTPLPLFPRSSWHLFAPVSDCLIMLSQPVTLSNIPPWAAACGPPCQSKLPQEQVCVDRRCKPEKQSSQYVWCVCISVVQCFSSINKDSKWALGHWQLALKHATYNKFDYPLTYLGIKSNQKQNSVKVLELWTSCLSTVFLTNSRGSSAHVQNYNSASSRLKIDLTHHVRLLGRYPATEKKEMKAFYIWTWQFHVLKKKKIIYIKDQKTQKISQAQFLQYI